LLFPVLTKGRLGASGGATSHNQTDPDHLITENINSGSWLPF
jgi:hypothetical protein